MARVSTPAKISQAEPQKKTKQVRFSKGKMGGNYQTKTMGVDALKTSAAKLTVPKCTVNEIEAITEQFAVLGKIDESLGESDLEGEENPSGEESEALSEPEKN